MTVDWGAGSYEYFAEKLQPAAREVVDVAAIRTGERVLDVGCGTGNAALLAAERGAVVTGVDPAQRLLDVAAERARVAGLDLELHVGEAAELPVAEASYDVVLSVFGAVFAPDARAALEGMTRALTSGGRIVVSAWVPGSAVAEMGRIARSAAASGGPPPFPWHDTAEVRALALPMELSVDVAERTLSFTADSPEAYLEAEVERHPAMMATWARVEQRADAGEVRAQMLAALRAGNEDPEAFRATSHYLVYTLRGA